MVYCLSNLILKGFCWICCKSLNIFSSRKFCILLSYRWMGSITMDLPFSGLVIMGLLFFSLVCIDFTFLVSEGMLF